MVEPEANNPTVESINGKAYNVHIIRKTQLFPLQAGSFEIDPVELDNKVKFIKMGEPGTGHRSPLQKLMDEYMSEGIGTEIEEQSFTLSSKPVTITVKPLPIASKPEGFNGAVGNFTLEAEIKDKSVTAGDALALKLLIKGKGNFTVINPPSVQLPAGLEGFDPKITENVDRFIYPLSGSKTFDYTIIAKDTGRFIIPAVAFYYFDPADAQYKTALSDSFSVHVLSSKKAMALETPRADSLPPPASAHWIDAVPINILVLAIAAIFFAGIGFYMWKRNRQQVKIRQSVLSAKPTLTEEPVNSYVDPLEKARWALKEEKGQLFYNEVNRAVWKKLSEKISIPATSLNKYNAIFQLQQKGFGTELIHQLEAVLHDCEMALYTPVHDYTDMQEMFGKADAVITALDREQG